MTADEWGKFQPVMAIWPKINQKHKLRYSPRPSKLLLENILWCQAFKEKKN